MATIKTPRNPEPSPDTVGPNYVETTNPGFDRSYRNEGGDVGSTTDYAGKKKPKEKTFLYGFE